MCKVCPLPFEQNRTHLSYKQNFMGSLHLVRGKDLDRTVRGIKSHLRWGPCASHKALAHSQNAPRGPSHKALAHSQNAPKGPSHKALAHSQNAPKGPSHKALAHSQNAPKGPSHKALDHSQNAPFSILTLTLHVMTLGGIQVSGKI